MENDVPANDILVIFEQNLPNYAYLLKINVV